MEEFLFVLQDLIASKLNLDVANQWNAPIQFDWHVVVYSFQIGELVRMNYLQRGRAWLETKLCS